MKKVSLALVALLTLVFTTTALAEDSFSDVQVDHQNWVAIEYLARNGVINGYADGSFGASASINRAEMMKMLVEGQGITPNENEYNNCFPDVQTDWYAKYVCYAKEAGWVGGYPDGTFQPANNVLDVEALKMILNARGIAVADSVKDAPYKDVSISEWFAPFVAKAKDRNLLEETGDMYAPGKAMTRGSVAEVLFRAIALTEGNVDVFSDDTAQLIFGTPMTKHGDSMQSSSAMEMEEEMEEEMQEMSSSSAMTDEEMKEEMEMEEEEAMEGKAQAVLTAESSIAFSGGKGGIAQHEGTFFGISGTLMHDGEHPDDFTKSKLDIAIEIGSMQTDNDGLTKHLLSDDFFAAETYPTATFVSTAIVPEQEEGSYGITGTLTLKDVSASVTFSATKKENVLELSYDLNRLTFNVGSEGDIDATVPLEASITFE